jgi:hypothetical protein
MKMDSWDYVFFVGFWISAFIPAWMTRKKNPGAIYLILYIFSFSFLLFMTLNMAAWTKGLRLAQLCGTYEASCQAVYGSLTKIEDELYLLATVAGLVLGPQILTYLLSGIFGAAQSPRFVEQTRKFVLWSYVKFNACLSGIQLASGLSKVITKADVFLGDLVIASLWLGLSFAYVFVESSERAPRSTFEKWAYRQLLRAHKFFTRHAHEEKPFDKPDDAAQDSTLPKL